MTREEVRALDDAALLEACADRGAHAWDELVRRFGRYVHFLVRLTASRRGLGDYEALLEDLYCDAFRALLEDDGRRLRLFEGRNGCSARSWLRVIVIRTTLNRLRRVRREVPLEAAPEPVDDADPLSLLLGRERPGAESMWALAEGLSPKDRLMLEMLYVRGLPAEEVAAALRTSRGAVYTRKTRVVQALRDAAREQGLVEV